MREPTFLILTALASGRSHGYGVIRSVENLSGGRVRLRAGTLYAALDRLVMDGFLSVDGAEVVDGRNRKYYEITDEGSEALRAQIERLEANVAVARRQLGVKPA